MITSCLEEETARVNLACNAASYYPRTRPLTFVSSSSWSSPATAFRRSSCMLQITARKIGFTLNLILIKVEVKYDHIFDPNFDVRQMCVKNVMALPIHLILDKEEAK